MASADRLIKTLEGVDANSFANEAERVRAMDALALALSKVQKPWDIVWQHCWVNPATNACAKTLIDAGVFNEWVKSGGAEKTCGELAALTGTDEVLIKRMMRQIAGQNLIIETAQDTYRPTPWVHALAADEALSNTYGALYDFVNGPMFRTLPFYLKETGYKNPTNPNDCNWQFMKKSKETLFESLGSDPVAAREFNDAMASHSKYNLTAWPEVYPTDALVADSKPDRPLVVDVGGSKGHDLEKFRLQHPDIPDGSLILQDLPTILKELDIPKTIKVHPHDFFTPQPVKGARAYFMHNVLHDWEDTQAKQILSHIADAMEPGYSKLLIHESLVSSVKPLARVTTSDLTMMACLGAKERTEAEWRELVESVGLRVLKIWRPPQSVESIIEAEVACVSNGTS
ncbi:sterigmatocystin 8-o-methyltransferase [Fusarium albosuccineum]|uniref:Sterigmatocystin 8-o-methyltransferase n=1 Tax=Fusarium albosuccineum TaxID=1237068 RepID=A0A8H4KUJ8_9HYPO|nr:sterigmatocystin 8-o-methyltransferase [Fusarium albosuccineum]